MIPTALPYSQQDFRILLIDDNLDANESTAELLKLFGYDVRFATNGVQALELVAEFSPHLVLSDIGLPGVDGYQLAPLLRQVSNNPNLTIAAITGYGQASDRILSEQAGFNGHLVKPLDVEVLLQFISSHAAKCNAAT